MRDPARTDGAVIRDLPVSGEMIIWQNEHYPDIVKGGGGARNTRHITASMARAGAEVRILARNVHGARIESSVIDGTPVTYYPRHWLSDRLWPIRGTVEAFLSHRVIGTVIHGSTLNFCIDPEFVFVMKRVARGVPVICRVEGTRAGDRASWHSLLARPGDRGTGRRGLLSRLARFQDDELNRRAWESSDGLIVKSRLILNELVRWYGIGQEKIRIIPNGVDFAHYANASVPSPVMDEIRRPPGAQAVAFVGRLSTVKNLALLLRAFARVIRPTPPILLIVGEGEERNTLEDLARQLSISARVRFLGHKDDVAPYLAAADVFVLPSLYETIANCLLEAMSAGVPCIALRPDGKRIRTSSDEVISSEETGVLVDEDAEALASAINAMLANPNAGKAMAERAQALVRARFDWDSCARAYVDFGRDLRSSDRKHVRA